MDIKQRIISDAEDNKEFVRLEDGSWYWSPKGHGAFGPHHLRWLADELDRRDNADSDSTELEIRPE
jgi:hypothetical protein